MARYEFRLPDIGEGVTEDQQVVEMMTDKATVELPATGTGVIVEQVAAEGDVVKTGSVLYVLETEARIAAAPDESGASQVRERSSSPAPVTGEAAGVLAPPAVRKLAREMGVNLASVNGTGPGGRISA